MIWKSAFDLGAIYMMFSDENAKTFACLHENGIWRPLPEWDLEAPPSTGLPCVLHVFPPFQKRCNLHVVELFENDNWKWSTTLLSKQSLGNVILATLWFLSLTILSSQKTNQWNEQQDVYLAAPNKALPALLQAPLDLWTIKGMICEG